jgi:hypothetical protein
MDPGLDARLGDEQRADERQGRDQEAVVVVDHVRGRHPDRERDGGVARRQAAAQRRPASRPGLRRDHDQLDEHERHERDLRRRIAHAIEETRAAMRGGVREDEVADAERGHGRDQDGARRHVLRQLRVRVERRRGDVDRSLDRRVDHLRDEHERDGEQERDQLEAADPECGRGGDHGDRDREVDSEVPLRAEDVDDPLERVVEAVEQRRRTAGCRRRARRPRPLRRRDGRHRCSASRASISSPWS